MTHNTLQQLLQKSFQQIHIGIAQQNFSLVSTAIKQALTTYEQYVQQISWLSFFTARPKESFCLNTLQSTFNNLHSVPEFLATVFNAYQHNRGYMNTEFSDQLFRVIIKHCLNACELSQFADLLMLNNFNSATTQLSHQQHQQNAEILSKIRPSAVNNSHEIC